VRYAAAALVHVHYKMTVAKWQSGEKKPSKTSRRRLEVVEKHGIEILVSAKSNRNEATEILQTIGFFAIIKRSIISASGR
jgi:hypothetical protein